VAEYFNIIYVNIPLFGPQNIMINGGRPGMGKREEARGKLSRVL
jgi:hypothetical protein